MKVEWDYPPPRPGLLGQWDTFIGPGATRMEVWLALGFALMFAAAVIVYATITNLGWSMFQYSVAGVLALDMAGGVVTNATSAAKRWYHRSGQGFQQHMLFIAVHAVQLFLVSWLFRGQDWSYFLIVYGCLLAASVIILNTSLYLQRPVAVMLLCGTFLLNIYAFSPTPGFEWFLPCFFLKLLVSHLLREEPYRP